MYDVYLNHRDSSKMRGRKYLRSKAEKLRECFPGFDSDKSLKVLMNWKFIVTT